MEIQREPHVVMEMFYKHMALIIGGVGITVILVLTLLAFIIRSRKWYDTQFDGRITMNVFILIMVGIVSVYLWKMPLQDKVEEYIIYDGYVTDVGKDYVTLKDDDKDEIFYDSKLKGSEDIPKEKQYNQRFNKGEHVKIKAVETYQNKGQIGKKPSIHKNGTYHIQSIKRQE